MNNSVAIAIIVSIAVCVTILGSIFLLNNNDKLPYDIPQETVKLQEEKAVSTVNKKNISDALTEEETKPEKRDPSMPPGFMSNAHEKKEKIVSKDGKTIATDDAAAVINWAHRYIEVVGIGKSSEHVLAREGAIANAFKRLGESVLGVNLRAGTSVKDNLVSSYTGTLVEGTLKGAIPIGGYVFTEDSENNQITCTVKYGYALDGDKGFLSYIRKHPEFFKETKEKGEVFKLDEKKDAEDIEAVKEKKFTGLIIDCSRFKINQKLTVSIKTKDGSNSFNLFRSEPLSYTNGTSTRYISSIKSAKALKNSNGKAVAGNNPLIIQAVGILKDNPVISRSDAVKVFHLDEKILNSGNTIIVL